MSCEDWTYNFNCNISISNKYVVDIKIITIK